MYSLRVNQQLLELDTPKIMGIVNCTSDSFYAGSRVQTEKQILERATQLLQTGATILDIGGCSTRPNSQPVPLEQEQERVVKALKCIRHEFPNALLSIDTFRASIAKIACQEYGVSLINDISGGADAQMDNVVAQTGAVYVLTHNQPLAPSTQPVDTMAQLLAFFQQRLDQLHRLGVHDVVLDPGFGFQKTVQQNYQILRHLSDLHYLSAPILVGLSRKSMVYKPLELRPEDCLNGTTALHMLALQNGASLLRTHDAQAAQEVITLFGLYEQAAKTA